jgi:hypothetical protein
MFASTIRPVRHRIPLPLSIVARPHEAGLIDSWRADSLAFVWLDPGITPCCKTPKIACGDFSAKRATRRQSPVDRASNPILESPMSLARCDVVPHVVIQSSHLRLGEFESHAAKRLLQQYRPAADVVAAGPLRQILARSARPAFSRGPAKSRNARIFNGTSGGPVWTR